jgi:hypothetical protein
MNSHCTPVFLWSLVHMISIPLSLPLCPNQWLTHSLCSSTVQIAWMGPGLLNFCFPKLLLSSSYVLADHNSWDTYLGLLLNSYVYWLTELQVHVLKYMHSGNLTRSRSSSHTYAIHTQFTHTSKTWQKWTCHQKARSQKMECSFISGGPKNEKYVHISRTKHTKRQCTAYLHFQNWLCCVIIK